MDVATEPSPLDPFPMLNYFSRCSCGLRHLARIERRPWMRLFSSLRFYQCSTCGKKQLASERAVNDAVWKYRSENV
ncbi:hypothetical protein [Variovorax boronicumulans]|uniref:hypothetical protein n=1 Tax=Variovorax boronicumulans TaxID=436515 RepID=UPI0013309FC7|nr:hypothetical protein [Variovorax boronicumulans]